MGTAINVTSFAGCLRGTEVQRFFWTQNSKMLHTLIKSLNLPCVPVVGAGGSTGSLSPSSKDRDPTAAIQAV